MLGNPDRPVGGIAVRPPPGVELRPLGRDDVEIAVHLAREQRKLPPAGDLAPLRIRYERLINSPDVAGFAAVEGGEVAGLAIAEFRRRLNFASFEGWLSDLFVRPASRGRGSGSALAQAIVAEWRLRGGHRIQAQVPAQAEAARATLRRLGFEEWMLDFRLAPVPPAIGDPAAPDGVSLRPLGPADGDAVTPLIAEFGPWRSPMPERLEAVMRSYAEHARSVAAGDAGSMVAEREGVVVGVCTLEWRAPFWDDRLEGWIPDLVVTEPLRGRGIGRALLAEAIRAAAERGAAAVTLESGLQRESAHRLYRNAGFAQTGTTHVLRREP